MVTTSSPPLLLGAEPSRRPPRMPDAWLRSAITGFEAAVLGWLAVVVPAVAVYVATAAAPVLGEASWVEATRVGTALWLLGHGASIHLAAGTTVSLAPLGISLLSLALLYGGSRRARVPGWGSAGFTVAAFVATTALLSLLVPGPAGRPAAVAGAAALAVLAVAAALWRSGRPVPAPVRRRLLRVPAAVRAGVRGAGWASLGLVGAATAVTAVAVAAGWTEVVELHRALAPETAGGVVLVLAQLLWVPTAVVWALAWIAGPGFTVGTGTQFSPGEVVAAPLPAVPVLGALPAPGSPGFGWVVLVPVVVGAVVGWELHRRRAGDRIAWVLSGAAVAGAGTGVVAGILGLAASGSIGPGRMVRTGVSAPYLAGAVAAEVAVGALLVVLVVHPDTRAWLARGFRGARAGVGGAVAARRAARAEAGTVPDESTEPGEAPAAPVDPSR